MSQTTDRFELQTRIAVGNAGLVYRGVDKLTRRRVALKLLVDTGLPYPLDGQALLRDAARVRRTAGNNIAQMLEVIDDEEGVVLVYEYADGVNWVDAVKERKLDGAQALDVAAQILSALAVGEAIRLPHGEIKPANLILGELPTGRLFVWVLDWGLARYRAEVPGDALPWLDPDQLRRAEPSAEADLFATGACLYWLLTGTAPVVGQTVEELVAAWSGYAPQSLSLARPDLPPKLTRWVNSLIDPQRRSRFSTVSQARQSLAALHPPTPPILPEIFRPRPKVAQAVLSSAPVRRPRVVAVPVVSLPTAPLEEISPENSDQPIEWATEEIPPEGEGEGESAISLEVVGDGASEEAERESAGDDDASWIESENGAENGVEEAWSSEFAAGEGFVGDEDAPVFETPATAAERWWTTVCGLIVLGLAWFFLYRSAPVSKSHPPTGPSMIAAENFDYPLGSSLAGQKGGSGWGGAWKTGGSWFTWKAPQGLIEASALPNPAGGASGQMLLVTNEGFVFRRALGDRGAFIDDLQGGKWLASFDVAFFSESKAAEPRQMQWNFFSGSNIDELIRVNLTENAGKITVSTFPEQGSATLPGPSNQLQHIVIGFEATPAGAKLAGKFHLTLRIWLNSPAGNPLLTTTASGVELPGHFGVRFQGEKTTSPLTLRLDRLRFGRTPQDLLP
ncbi:MAG: serine/threonine-protein kinase [Verrucomicrobiota bacterium]